MRRILVVGCLPGINGISTCICNLYKHLDRSQFEWEFLVSRSSLETDLGFGDIEALGGRIHSLDYTHKHYPRSTRSQLRDLMLSIPDLCGVHLHDSGQLNVYPIYLAQQLDLPVQVIQIHASGGIHTSTASMSPHALAARRHLISRDSVERLACSMQAGKNAYHELSFSVFPNATDLERFSYNPIYRKTVRNRLGIPDTSAVIGFPGHFWPIKNPLFAVEVFAEFHRIRPDSHMILLGDGSLRSSAYHMCESEGLLPFAHFLGFQADIELFLNAMDLILCTSFSEGLGNVLIESQASGLHCLVSDGVPPEAQLTDLCTQMSLESPPSKWAEKIAESLDRKATRRSYHDELTESGYDIIDSTYAIQELYNSRLIFKRSHRI